MFQKLVFKPGINREITNYSAEGGWYAMDKVRFRGTFPTKIGGWRRAADDTYQGVARNLINWTSLTGENMIGVGTHIRYFICYGQLYNNITPLRATQSGLSDPFDTVSGSTTITVNDASHGATVGDYVIFSGASTFAGITAAVLNAEAGHLITNVIDADTYEIVVSSAASSTTSGGGTVAASYEIHTGLPVYTLGNGWGAGVWNGPIVGGTSTTLTGTSPLLLDDNDTTINVTSTAAFTAAGTLLIDAEVITYSGKTATTFTGCTRGTQQSTAANHAQRMTSPGTYASIPVYQVLAYSGDTSWGSASSSGFGIGLQMQLWSSDTFGEDLIFAPRGGAMYYWAKDTSAFVRAEAIRDTSDATRNFVPHTTNCVLVSDTTRFVVAFGANSYDPGNANTTFDPLLVRWSAQEDAYNYIPAATNQAGEFRLSAGSFIMTAKEMRQEILVWTNAALYSMQYLGPPLVHGFNVLMANMSLMSPNAVAVANTTAFWMGVDKFYVYNGVGETLPCDVRQFVFDDLATEQAYQTTAGTNEGFNEVWWHYVSNDEVEAARAAGRIPLVDKYVVFNYQDRIWYYGTLSRTAWIDSPLQDGPLAAYGDEDTGRLLVHEQGTDDVSGTVPVAIESYIQSADFDIGDGDHFMFVSKLQPDVSFNGSTVATPAVTITLKPRQNSGAPYTTSGTEDAATVTSAQTYSAVTRQYTVQEFTQMLYVRLRGRQMAFRIGSTGLGVQWQLGVPRIDAKPDGRKS